MAYYTYTKDPIGCFVEKDTGNYFEYSVNDETYEGAPVGFALNYPHKVWVGGEGVCGMSGWRYAPVTQPVAYVIVDEDEGGPILERWFLKKNTSYA